MRLSDVVSLVGSGDGGCSYTHPNDCNVYAIRCGAKSILIDSGVGINTQNIMEKLEADGFTPQSVSAVILTHGHLDHSGGAYWFHGQGIPVIASEKTAKALKSGDEEAISLKAAKSAGIYAPEVAFHRCPVVRHVQDGDRFKVGEATVEVVSTPGHSDDHVSYLVQLGGRVLAFTGDTVFHGGKILMSDTHDCNPAAYARSLRRLATFPIDGLFPGHSIWSLQRGDRHVKACLSSLDRLLLPPNLM